MALIKGYGHNQRYWPEAVPSFCVMKRSSYWYIRLLTGRKVRPLIVGLVTGAVLLLIFIIWVAILNWLGRGVLLFSREFGP
jgi:hypothetical protein